MSTEPINKENLLSYLAHFIKRTPILNMYKKGKPMKRIIGLYFSLDEAKHIYKHLKECKEIVS